MSMLEHIQQFAMHIAPERQWMALVAEVFERAKYAPLTVATPRSMYEPLTIATSYGFNVVVEGPERPAYMQAVDRKIETVVASMEMFGLCADLGIPFPTTVAELLRSTEPPEDSQGVGCKQCGEVNCTKNHAEFM